MDKKRPRAGPGGDAHAVCYIYSKRLASNNSSLPATNLGQWSVDIFVEEGARARRKCRRDYSPLSPAMVFGEEADLAFRSNNNLVRPEGRPAE